MRRKFAFTLLLVVLAAIGFLGYSIYDRLEEKQAVEKRIATLPEFELVTLEGQSVNSNETAAQKFLVLTYFNTGCEFCQAEIRSMQQYRDLQEKSNIYLISDESPNVLKQFVKEFELDSVQNMEVYWDSSRAVKGIFGITGVPSTFIYDADGRLVKSFKGETKAEVLYALVK